MAGLLDQIIKPIGALVAPKEGNPPGSGGTTGTGPATGAGPNPSTPPPPLSPVHPDFVHGLVPQPEDKTKLSGIAKLLLNPSQEIPLGEIVGP